MEFSVKSKCNSDPKRILEIMGEAMKLPEYWHGMREITKNGNFYSVRFQFPGTSTMEYLCDKETMTCTEMYLKGPFTGSKTVSVYEEGSQAYIEATWNIKLSLTLRIMEKRLQKHFTEGSKNALMRICEAASEN